MDLSTLDPRPSADGPLENKVLHSCSPAGFSYPALCVLSVYFLPDALSALSGDVIPYYKSSDCFSLYTSFGPGAKKC